MSEATVKEVQLSPTQVKVLLKALAILAPSYSEIEIKEGRICNKSDDKVVTYKIDLPLPDSFEIIFIKLANMLKYLKDFSDYNLRVVYTDKFYFLIFEETDKEGNLKEVATFKLRKPDLVTNVYNYDKIQNLESFLQFTQITDDLELLNRIRTLAARFKNDVLVDLNEGKLKISDADKNVTFEKEVNVSGKDLKFKIRQFALPTVELQEEAVLSYATLDNDGRTIVIYKLESLIDLNGHDVPITVYGSAAPVSNSLDLEEV